ncbi:phosphatidylglycerol lysyltransferase domain-containing protein [Glutamicibacter sp.]|uniref:bifunctional lysylphosphatidylglycerol flippase/synthetase MprF n=1 Tax=Glutamicibacter sp. TaxID=1931995 RepID=UPI0028BEFDF8|nr:phosphatidylglycerol lysyltransferase domain-containing protein [Glutamicibacter sp.]
MTSAHLSAVAQVRRRDKARAAAAYLAIALAVLSLVEPFFRPLQTLVPALLPEFLIQISRVYVIFGAFGLLVLAKYLRAGNRVAWAGSLGLLGLNTVLHLGKVSDLVVAVLSAGALIWLACEHRAFPVRPGRAFTRRVLVVALVVMSTATLIAAGVLVRHVRRTGQSFGDGLAEVFGTLDSELHEPAAHPHVAALIALVFCLLGVIAWLFWDGLHPRRSGTREHRAARERARAVFAAHGGGTLDYFALRDDKDWFFLHHSMVAYAVRGSVALVSPDPIGPEAEREEVWAEFMLFAERQGLSVSVMGAAAQWLETYEASGLRPIYLGDEAIVESGGFTLAGKKSKSLRQSHARLLRAGYRIEHLMAPQVPARLREQLLELSTQSRQGEAERGFSMTLSRLFDPLDTELLLSIAFDADDAPQAFIQWVPAPALDGWSLDVMRRSTAEDLPGGLTDFIIIETILMMAGQGRGGLGLNFAVLRDAVDPSAKASRLEKLVAKQASKHAQVASLYRFNAKYDPRWAPRYAAVGTVDLWLAQGLRIAQAEGYAELPGIERFAARGEGRTER